MGRLLIDTDIFVLLAGAGVLSRAVELLGFEWNDIRRLDALPSQLERGRSFRAKFSEQARKTALVQSRTVAALREAPDRSLMVKLETNGLDVGEAFLVAMLVEKGDWLLTTKDQRALEVLATNPNLAETRGAVAGRVVCFEQILRLLATADGVKPTANAFAAVQSCDRKLEVFFSPNNVTHADQCLEGLDSYLRALREKLGADFLFDITPLLRAFKSR